MEIIQSNRAKTKITNEGDTFTITQKYKDCSCQTLGQGENQIGIHMRAKKNCGENCLRYKYHTMQSIQ